mgnify:CR=1 FL=1
MSNSRRWTQADITDLRARVHAGEARGAIAAALGRDQADVTLMIYRLRLRRDVAY